MDREQLEEKALREKANSLSEEAKKFGNDLFIAFRKVGNNTSLSPFLLMENGHQLGFWRLKPAVDKMENKIRDYKKQIRENARR